MEISCSELSVHRAHQNTVKVASAHRYSEHAFFFSVLPPPNLSLRKIQKLRSGTQPRNLNFQLPPTDVTVRGKKLQASHHILYIHSPPERERNYLEQIVTLPSQKGQCHPMRDQQPRCTGTKSYWYPHFTPNYLGRRRHRVLQGRSAGEPLCTTGWKQTQKVLLELPSKPGS